MTIENKKMAYKVRIRGLFTTLFFTLLIVAVLTSGLFEKPILGLSKYQYTVILASLYLLISLYFYILDLNYVFYNDDGDKIIFRYSSLRPWTKRKIAIEIPKKNYGGYSITNSFFNIKKNLTLYQVVNNKRAKYPSVCLTSLTKKEYSKLLSSLSRLSKVQ